MSERPHISIVIPVFDELDSLEPLHRELDAVSPALGERVEILFVDDCSTDGSADRLAEIAEKDARVRVLTLSTRSGQSAALGAGFDAASGEVIATLDADLQNDPAELPRMLARLLDADVVCGIRTPRADAWSRRVSARIGNALTGASVTDVGCALRVMRADFVKKVKMFRGMHRFLPTLLAMEGARVVEIPVSHRPRRFGHSKYGILDRVFVGFVDVLAVRWMQSRTVQQRVRERKRR
jgi:dolichol-phosphate mannosyltransferase